MECRRLFRRALRRWALFRGGSGHTWGLGSPILFDHRNQINTKMIQAPIDMVAYSITNEKKNFISSLVFLEAPSLAD